MKKLLFAAGFVLSLLLAFQGCKSYKQVTVKNDEFLSDDQMQQDIGYYDLYVHHGTTSFRVKDPKIEDKKLKGTLVPVDQSQVVLQPKDRKDGVEHKKDINMHLKSLGNEAKEGQSIAIDANDIARVDMYADDDKGVLKTVGGLIVALLLGVLLITGMIFLLARASDNAANGSGSNSNSDSGDSGSGDSSDGGGSNSGCYVATMVYGSYEAPEVWVLRRFRDRVLTHSRPGRAFITWYYKHSPGFVERWKNSPAVNTSARFILNVFVKLLSWAGFHK